MSKRARQIRRYQVSFNMTRKQAEAFADAMEAKETRRRTALLEIETFHSDELGQVTVPA